MLVEVLEVQEAEREITIEGLEVVEGRLGRHGSCL